MTKLSCINSVKKIVSIITMAGFLGLSTLQPAFGFEPEPYEVGTESQMVGIGFSGGLDFKNLRITGFSYSPMKGVHGSSTAASDSMFRTEDGLVKVNLPLFTFGDDIKYPGIFYNHNGNQFYQYMINSTEGDKAAQTAMTPYILAVAGVCVAVFAFAYAGSSSSDSASSDAQADPDTTLMDTPPDEVPVVVETPVQLDETAQADQEAAAAESQTPIL